MKKVTKNKLEILDARVDKSNVTEVYQGIAPIYDLWGRLTESRARDRCLELASIQDGESILEVAVGTGLAFTKILTLNPNGRKEGIDLTEEMLIRAKSKAQQSGIGNYNLVLGDAYNLEYPDNTFDTLINNYMFDLLPESDFPQVLDEFKRVLRPGGRLVMVNMTKGEHWYNSIWETIYRMNPAWLGGCRGVLLMPYLESAGFKNVKREFISQITWPSEVVLGVKPENG